MNTIRSWLDCGLSATTAPASRLQWLRWPNRCRSGLFRLSRQRRASVKPKNVVPSWADSYQICAVTLPEDLLGVVRERVFSFPVLSVIELQLGTHLPAVLFQQGAVIAVVFVMLLIKPCAGSGY